jgi:hypothetical protein
VAKITGVSRKRIIAGLKDLAAPPLDPGRIRRKGGGRRPITETDGTIVEDLKHLVEPVTMGDPMRPLMWVRGATFHGAVAGTVLRRLPRPRPKLLTHDQSLIFRREPTRGPKLQSSAMQVARRTSGSRSRVYSHCVVSTFPSPQRKKTGAMHELMVMAGAGNRRAGHHHGSKYQMFGPK